MTWVLDNLDLIAALTLEHLRQCLLPILLGFVLAIPLGWVAFRFRLTRGLVLTVTGLLYTIPSLALFAILPTVLGIRFLSEANLVIALTIYAVAIMARSISDALGSVDPAVRQAATAVGYGPWRRFWTVEFPLAGPVILAGLRVAAVSTIALATVGILIGVENLGYLFTNGLQRRIIPEVFAGVIAVMLVALVIDALLVLAGRLLMPWAPRRTAGRRRRLALRLGEAA
ncbi:ABC transporter permease [Protaetiibacter mangrovi]|uniref:ABC transporter permease n=1 Tax=Protaetiibacter mangrovi TaxID=2970926 RepID=A0ABT1ZEY7_9MICO|nr:ABC transporter permease [Protaetiibacter mangrovi]MCS0499225.1 ABC transporter permease [Protaetiibacter mangrovi]TPX04805.1 ABC transporter permease [Schumannella luteola]